MKLWASDFVFNAPWKQTTEAVWKKYPNELQPNVEHIDVIDRKVTTDGKLLTTRLFGSHFSFPKLITTLLGLPEICYAIELSEVDLKTQQMTLRMINWTFGSVLTVDEKLVYSPVKDNVDKTSLDQTAKVSINGIPFPDYFENMIVTRFESTAKLGRKAIQHKIQKITVEDILNTVKRELLQLSSELDEAASKLDSIFSITERVLELYEDLDRAAGLINTEIQSFSEKLHSEFLQIIRSLDSELSQVVVKLRLTENGDDIELSRTGLFEAVKRAGISANRGNV